MTNKKRGIKGIYDEIDKRLSQYGIEIEWRNRSNIWSPTIEWFEIVRVDIPENFTTKQAEDFVGYLKEAEKKITKSYRRLSESTVQHLESFRYSRHNVGKLQDIISKRKGVQ